MKKAMLFVLLSVFLGPLAHSDSPTTAAITRQAMLANKKAMVAQNLKLTPDEEKVFWPAYDNYQIGMNNLNDQMQNLIQKFAINYDSVTDDLATQLVDQFFKLEKDRLAYRQNGVDTFRKLISAKNVARFVQIENKIQATVRADIAQQVPLAK